MKSKPSSTSMKIRTLTPLIFASTFLAAPAAVVVTGTTATASTTYVHGQISTANLVNNSGLSVADDVTATHATFGTGPTGNGWHSTGGTVANEFVTIALNGSYSLDSIYIWQMNQAGTGNLGRGVRQFDLLVSSDGNIFTEVASDLELAQAPNTDPISAQAFALNQTGVTHVRIGIDSAWSGNASEYVGLGEVKFTTVPEPSAALLGGLGLLGLLRRRR